MGTHTVRTDCQKFKERDSLVFSYYAKVPFSFDAFCLNCGWSYKTIEKKLDDE